MRKSLILFILSIIVSFSFATTVTINPDGSGDYQTFTELFTALTADGISGNLDVEVAAGTYVESATLSGSIPGADENNTVHIYPVGGSVVIDGGWNAYAIGLMNTSWVHIEGLDMISDVSNEFSNGALYIGGSTNIDISHSRIHQSGFVGLLVSESQNIRLWNNFIYDTAAASLSIAMCGADANIEIWNNSFYYNYPYFGGFFGQPAQCIALTESSANVHNNTFFKDVNDEGDGGPMDSSKGIVNIDFMGGSMETFFTSSSFDNNVYYTEPGTKLFQVGFMEFFYDLESLNTAYGFAGNSVFGDPMFDDAANGDLNIASTESACYDGGASGAWFTDDINYETREHWDMGADFILGDISADLYPPTNLQYAIQQETNVYLTWDAADESILDLLGYNIYRNDVQINGEVITDTEYLDNGLAEGTYSYYVTAVYNEGESEPTEVVQVEIVIMASYGDITLVDIPWVLNASSDGFTLVGGVEGAGGGMYWTEPDGNISIPESGSAADISDDGKIAGQAVNEDGNLEACWWDIDNLLEPNFIGTVDGGSSMSNELNSVGAISDDGYTIVGLAWYNLGAGSAKAYKWTPETGSVLLPEVLNYSDSRADCVTPDGSLIGGYAAEERSIWRPVLWSETELIQLPYAVDTWSVVHAISPNGEWYSGYNGNKGIVWHNQEIIDLVGDEPEFIQTKFRAMTDEGWTGGETANWNTMVSEPVIWNPQDGLMNAVDFFEANGVNIPEDYELFRVRWISNDHLTFVCNGTNLNNYQYQSSVIRLSGPHGVSNFNLIVENDSDVHLTWNFDDEFSPAQNIVLKRNGELLATLSSDESEYFDENLTDGDYAYEIYVTYNDYDNSVSRIKEISIENFECTADGDVNMDGSTDVTDVVMAVGYVLGTTEFNEENLCQADMTEDGIVDILDIVAMIDSILGNGRLDAAEKAQLIRSENSLSLTADGYVDAVEIHISHSEGIMLYLSTDTFVADYVTDGTSSVIIIVGPETEFLFAADSEFEVNEIIAASQNGYIDIQVAQSFALLKNYPNPFNPRTTIEFSLPADGIVSLVVYDLQGKMIEELINEDRTAGFYNINWDAGKYASGVYLLKMQGIEFQNTQKLILLK